MASDYEAAVFTGITGDQLPYRFLKPEGPAGADIKYPLVVFLHGAGERGADNKRQICNGAEQFLTPELRNQHPCFVIAPQCPENSLWVDVDGYSPVPHTMPAQPSRNMALLLELIPQIIKNNPIDTSRVYAVGLSMGGYGAWDLLARRPEWFAAAVAVCGGADLATASRIATIPLWVWHGEADPLVPVVRSRLMVEALKKAGSQPKYTELPGVGHNAWEHAFYTPELYRWLFSHHQNKPK